MKGSLGWEVQGLSKTHDQRFHLAPQLLPQGTGFKLQVYPTTTRLSYRGA